MTPANIQDEDMQWLTTLSGTQANIKGKRFVNTLNAY